MAATVGLEPTPGLINSQEPHQLGDIASRADHRRRAVLPASGRHGGGNSPPIGADGLARTGHAASRRRQLYRLLDVHPSHRRHIGTVPERLPRRRAAPQVARAGLSQKKKGSIVKVRRSADRFASRRGQSRSAAVGESGCGRDVGV